MQTDRLFVAQPEVVDCDIGGDRALLHLGSNNYFTMNATAAALWLELSQPKSMDELVRIVVDRFDVSEDQCRPDVETLIEQMLDAQIVRTAQAEATR